MYLLKAKPCFHPRKSPVKLLTNFHGQSGSVTGRGAGPASPGGPGKVTSYFSVSFICSFSSQSKETAIIL